MRNGVPTLLKISRVMCRYVAVFSPGLRTAFASNAALLVALTAAETACGLLVEELEAIKEYGD